MQETIVNDDKSGTYYTRNNMVAIVVQDRYDEFTGNVYASLDESARKNATYMHWDSNGVAMNGDKEMDLML